jgi:hypothetical protein
MSKTALYLAAAAISASVAATAALADEDRAPREGMTEQAISQIVTYAGYDVVDFERDGSIYRVKAYEPAGEKVRLRVIAEDGSIQSAEARRTPTAALD